MADRGKKVVIQEEVPGAHVALSLLLFGDLDLLIELLQSDREIPRIVRAGLCKMLKADPSNELRLVCQTSEGKRPPSKNFAKQIRDFRMGSRVLYMILTGSKYEAAIRDVAEEFEVKLSTVEKAYTAAKKAYSESEAKGLVPPLNEASQIYRT